MVHYMKEEIKSWGLPKVLKDINVIYRFNENKIGEESAKFWLIDSNTEEELFVFDFFEIPLKNRFINDKRKIMNIQFICVLSPEFRNNGIATYYLDKLKEYVVKNNFDVFRLEAAIQKNINPTNALKIDKLAQFYIDILSDDKMDKPAVYVNYKNINE
ncbi:hypothetical protein RAK27_18015 [Carnobacterium maltaromaticum]|uniref:N-acetyltransferase domain-containing protein n=1 Tax=Carnobacterium maltaromaticum TaxID=2751 RepID=A0AAW9K432_CARML|nr:hypothetical protein [Carnobacterium maltaromaticum]MDZ5760541.1 hypothetical protein [Carnobacterium maltaromaticum]